MTTRRKLITVFLTIAAAVMFMSAHAADDAASAYKLLTTITIPGGLTGFDISWVDSKSARYYLSDRGNSAATPPVSPRIDVIDTDNDTYLDSINLSTAPNGVVAIRGIDANGQGPAGALVVGGSNSTAIFIDLSNPHGAPLSVSTGGNHRADELAYDPMDHIILIANDQDTPAPFISFISTSNPPHVLGKIVYDGSLGNPKSTGGIEQPVWNTARKRFYISIPSTVANPKGEVDEIDPTTMTITRVSPTTCGPAGLAQIPGQNLITSCGDILDIRTGAVVQTVAGVSGDEIWFNSGDERVYFGGGLDRISVPVVNGVTPFNLITILTVGTTAVTPAHTTHSVAADSDNNHIFVPVSHEGVKVYTEE